MSDGWDNFGKDESRDRDGKVSIKLCFAIILGCMALGVACGFLNMFIAMDDDFTGNTGMTAKQTVQQADQFSKEFALIGAVSGFFIGVFYCWKLHREDQRGRDPAGGFSVSKRR